jgi:hypothetical protein
MPQQKFPQTDVYDHQTLRNRHYDDLELLVAASEVESTCAGWLFDQRANAEFATQDPAS